MGTVYLADQFAINRKVALKILNPDYARDEDFIKRFRQEATLAASLSHYNVVTVFDFDQADDGSLYIVMEYVDGRSLAEVIQNNPMAVSSAINLGIQIAEGLSAAHRAGVIHRDIKPENIMVVGGKTIKLMDFGIARLRDSAASTRLTQAGMIMGTPAYMAPEQIEGGELSDRTDIYAFGVVLYEMLTGYVPFKAPTPGAVLVKHLHEIPIPLRSVRKEIPSSVEGIVGKALQKNPEKRLENMESVVEALKTAQREVEQSKLDGVSSYRPTVAVRRALGVVGIPFGFRFRKGTSRRPATERNVEVDLDLHQPFSEEPKKPPSSSTLTASAEIQDTEETTFNPPVGVPPEDKSKSVAGLQTREISEGQSEKAKTGTPGTPTVGETIACTQLLAELETLGDYIHRAGTSDLRETQPPAVKARTKTDAWPASSRHNESYVVRSPEGYETRNLNSRTRGEQQQTATDITLSNASIGRETIAETVTFTQPVKKLAIQKKSWIVAASVSVSLILIGVVGGLMLFRDSAVTPSVENIETKQSDATETAVPPAQTGQLQRFSEIPKEDPEARTLAPPVTPAPEVKTKERSASKDSRVKEKEVPPTKARETISKRTDATQAKKTESTFANEPKSTEQAKTASVDQEQKPYQSPVSDTQLTKKTDSTSKKAQEPEDQVASLSKPEAPSPDSIPTVLKDLSIVTNRRDLKVKERLPLSVKARYSDGKESDITARVQWRSSDSSVAVVNAKGELEALKEGKAQISATYNGVPSGTYTFNVRPGEETPKLEEPGEQIKDLRRRLLR